MNSSKILAGLASILLLTALLFGAWKLTSGPKSPPQAINLQIAKNDWIKGKPNNKVILVEYSDFQCPACGAYYPLVKQVEQKYKDKIAFVYRHFPLTSIHKNAFAAAMAAEAAGRQNKFWEMHDLLFENQSLWSDSNEVEKVFIEYAKQLQLNIEQFTEDLENNELKRKVEDSMNFGNQIGINATPTFYLNGVKIESPQSVDEFSTFIDEQLKSKT